MRLFVCGDIMPGGVLPYQDKYFSEDMKVHMKSFDFRIGTLESAIGTGLAYDPVKMAGRQNIIYARNEDFFRIREMGFDVVSLANNHIWDLGEEGLKSTIHLLKENGIRYCGAGMDAEEASRPVVLEKDGLQVAFLAYCVYGSKWLGYVEPAGKSKPGVNVLEMERAVREIRKAKDQYGRVIVLPHWGREYTEKPLDEHIKMAKAMVAAGADAVLGSHPHRIQPTIMYKGRTICFSMGNFLFPDFLMTPPRPIWYPDRKECFEGVKKVTGYPFPVKEPVLRVWKDISRYGRVFGLNCGKKGLSVRKDIVEMNRDNIVFLSGLPWNLRRALWKNHLKTKLKLSGIWD